jgi:hypothetical protein
MDLLFGRGGFDYRFGVFEIPVNRFYRLGNSILLSRQSLPCPSGDEGEHTFRIISPTTLALAICFSFVVAFNKASVRCSAVSFRTADPTPRDSTRSDQNA